MASLDIEYPSGDANDLPVSTPVRPTTMGDMTSPDRMPQAKWETPAFLKTARMSLGSPLASAFDPFAEDQDEESKRRRKRPRFSFPSSKWKLVDEPEQPEEKIVANGDAWFASDEEELDRMDEDAVEHSSVKEEDVRRGVSEDGEVREASPEERGAAIPPELPPAPSALANERSIDVPCVKVEHLPHRTDRLPTDTPRLQPVPSPGLPTPSPMVQTEPSASMGYFAGISAHEDANVSSSTNEVAPHEAKPSLNALHLSTAAQEAEALAISAEASNYDATVVHHAATDDEPHWISRSEHVQGEVHTEKILDKSVTEQAESDQEEESSVTGEEGDQTDVSGFGSSDQESEPDRADSVSGSRSIDRISKSDAVSIDFSDEDDDDDEDEYSDEEAESQHLDKSLRIESRSPAVSVQHLQRDESEDSTGGSAWEALSEDQEKSIEMVDRSEDEEEEESQVETGAFPESVGSEIENEEEEEEEDEDEEEEEESDASHRHTQSSRPPASSYPEVIVLDSDSDEEPRAPPQTGLVSRRNEQISRLEDHVTPESAPGPEMVIDEVQDSATSEVESQEELSSSEKDESVIDDREADHNADDDADTHDVEVEAADFESSDGLHLDPQGPVTPTVQSAEEDLASDRTPSVSSERTPDGVVQWKQEQLAQRSKDVSHVKRGPQLVSPEHTQPSFAEQEPASIDDAPDEAIPVPTPQDTQVDEIQEARRKTRSPSLPRETAPPSATGQDYRPPGQLVEQQDSGDKITAAISHAESEQGTSPSNPATETLDDEVVLIEDRSSLHLVSSSPARLSDLHHESSSTPNRQAAGLRTELSYYPRLCTLHEWFGSTVDIMAIVVEARPVSRASSGPGDAYVTIHITDSSMAGATVSVYIFRPNPADLPTVTADNGVILRNFHVQSHGHAMILSSGDVSAVAVFNYDNEDLSSPEMSGPPVEYGDQERKYLAELRDWYRRGGGASLVADYMLQSSLIQEYEEGTPPSSVASSETASIASSSQSRRSRRRDRRRYRRITIHELRSGTKYAESGSNVHELRDGTLYGAYT